MEKKPVATWRLTSPLPGMHGDGWRTFPLRKGTKPLLTTSMCHPWTCTYRDCSSPRSLRRWSYTGLMDSMQLSVYFSPPFPFPFSSQQSLIWIVITLSVSGLSHHRMFVFFFFITPLFPWSLVSPRRELLDNPIVNCTVYWCWILVFLCAQSRRSAMNQIERSVHRCWGR